MLLGDAFILHLLLQMYSSLILHHINDFIMQHLLYYTSNVNILKRTDH